MNESKVIIITTIFNFIVAVLKLIAGLAFSFSTLISDSIQSFTDFITDITSLIANKIGKRRANKKYPFGYGQVYYLANLFTGLLLFLIGVFILYQFFFSKAEFSPDIRIVVVLLVVLVLKYMVVYFLHHYGKSFKSELMIESSKESRADFISTCVVLVVLFISFFEKYMPPFIDVDKIGSLGMAIYVFYASMTMIIANIRGILTNDQENTELKGEIEDQLKSFNKIHLKNIKIIKMSTYYSVFLQVSVDEKISMRKYITIEKEIKKQIKSKNKLIRFIDIEPC